MARAEAARQRLLGPDTPGDLVAFISAFFGFAAVDRLSIAAVSLDIDDLQRPSLLLASAGARWWAWLGFGAVLLATVTRSPTRFVSPWSELDGGPALRLVAGTSAVVVGWKVVFAPMNFLAERLHTFDRLVVAALVLAVVWRPVAAIALVVALRVLLAQTTIPFATTASANIDDLPVVVIAAVGAGHLLFTATGRSRMAPVLAVVTAAVCAHFYLPAQGKLAIGWLGANDVANLPIAAYTAGWLGHGDGGWARGLASLLRAAGPSVALATLVLELGAVAAAAHHRVLRWWLAAVVVFHAVTFATVGYWFLEWIVVEVTLIVVVTVAPWRSWVVENVSPARVLVTVVAATVGAASVYHPPGLAWLDSPVAYGYRIEATGVDGVVRHVPPSAFAPLDQELLFNRLELGSESHASGAYGVVATTGDLARLNGIASLDELTALEHSLDAPTATATQRSEAFITAWLDHTNERAAGRWPMLGWLPSSPGHFWAAAPEPRHDPGVAIEQLRVYVVRSIVHDDGSVSTDQAAILTVSAQR